MKEELKKATDYSEGQKTAAYMVLGEIVNLLNEFSDNIRIIGGWVPTLLYPDGDHIGSIDVDVLLNQLEIKKAESYRTIKRILTQNGYRRHEEKYFTFIKTIVLDGVSYDVDVDFLSGKYGGDGGNVSKHVDGIKTLPATGGNFAFDFPPTDVKIEYMREDGAKDSGHVKVISVVPYLVMKTAALGRGKPKDAYDIYYMVDKYEGGVRTLVKEFMPYTDRELIREMCQKLDEKFASPQHAGPTDVVTFMGITEEEEKEIRPSIPTCEIGRWYPSFADITAKGDTKQKGIDEIIRYFGIKLEETMAFGDGGNDITMLRHAAIGVAMGQAKENVKAAADYVTAPIDEDGISKAMKHFGII